MKKVVNLNESPSAWQITSQLLTVIGVFISSGLISGYLGLVIASLIFDVPIMAFSAVDYATAPQTTIEGLKIIQFISMIGTFLIPGLILPRLIFGEKAGTFLSFRGKGKFVFFVLATLAFFALMPLLDLSISLNRKIDLPDSFLEDWMRKSEDSNGALTQRFLYMPTIWHFIFNIFLIAVLPAFAEEIFFRGFFQRAAYRWWRNKHVAIIVTAAFFSFIHFQFFGFVPRMLLGMLLGYLLVWSGDLKLPIFVHFVNNFTSLLAAYFMQDQLSKMDINEPFLEYPWYVFFFSALIGGFFLNQLYKLSRKNAYALNEAENNEQDIKWVKVFSSHSIYEAEIVTGNLENEGIQAVIINKKDSSYQNFGDAEVYVASEDVERAKQFIPSQEL